jgi:hypothetical protein
LLPLRCVVCESYPFCRLLFPGSPTSLPFDLQHPHHTHTHTISRSLDLISSACTLLQVNERKDVNANEPIRTERSRPLGPRKLKSVDDDDDQRSAKTTNKPTINNGLHRPHRHTRTRTRTNSKAEQPTSHSG